MARIAIDARESGTSTGRYVDKMIEYIYRLNPKHDFVILAKSHRVGFLKSIAPTFEIVDSNFREFTFAEQLGFKKHIKKINPDLVHFPMPQQPIWYNGRVVTTIHDLTTLQFRNPSKNWLIFSFKQQVYKMVLKKAARKSIKVITGSRYTKNDIKNFTGISASKIEITNEAADKITNKAEPIEALAGKKFIMYVGRPQPHKNLHRLIEAFLLLKSDQPDLWLVLAGKQDELYRQHQKYVQDNDITNILFTGFISDGELRWLYENTSAYVFPSLSEGFGLPGMEAMIQGAPVVSSNATCLPEIYGDAAAYFDPLDISDIAAKIDVVLQNNKLRNEMIKNGRKQAAKYSWNKLAKETLAIYESCLK
jgi:glycosyltransferase involved in cell wall biosynthesis